MNKVLIIGSAFLFLIVSYYVYDQNNDFSISMEDEKHILINNKEIREVDEINKLNENTFKFKFEELWSLVRNEKIIASGYEVQNLDGDYYAYKNQDDLWIVNLNSKKITSAYELTYKNKKLCRKINPTYEADNLNWAKENMNECTYLENN